MELRDFVSKAIVDLVEAVKDAQRATGRGIVVPNLNRAFGNYAELGYTNLQAIDFEVQVKVEKSEGKEATIGVATLLVGKMGESKSGSDEHTATLRFKVPVALPICSGAEVRSP